MIVVATIAKTSQNEMEKKSHNETDPDIYVHFRRSLWPHRFILAPTNNFQLW